MPRLKRYADGRGYYLTGYIPEHGYCTWQIGREGIAFLKERGIASHGDVVGLSLLRQLLDRSFICTDKGGLALGPAFASEPWVPLLAKELVGWAADGGIEALTRLVCPGDAH